MPLSVALILGYIDKDHVPPFVSDMLFISIYLFDLPTITDLSIRRITAITHVYQGRKLEPGYA
jgi:hypothetical protein